LSQNKIWNEKREYEASKLAINTAHEA